MFCLSFSLISDFCHSLQAIWGLKLVYSHFVLRQSYFKIWFSCNHETSIFHEMSSYRTIWRPFLPHTTKLFQVSLICNFIWAPFLSYFSMITLAIIIIMIIIIITIMITIIIINLNSFEADNTDSNNWISSHFTSL